MKPRISILNPAFRYVPSVATSVASTWRRFGWKPGAPDESTRRLPRNGRQNGERLPKEPVAA